LGGNGEGGAGNGMGKGFGLGLGIGSDGLGTGSVGPGLGASTAQAKDVSIINDTLTNRPIRVEHDFISPPAECLTVPDLIRRPSWMFDSSADSFSHSADIPQRTVRTRHDGTHVSHKGLHIGRRHRRTTRMPRLLMMRNDSSIARPMHKYLHIPCRAGCNPPSSDYHRCDPFQSCRRCIPRISGRIENTRRCTLWFPD